MRDSTAEPQSETFEVKNWQAIAQRIPDMSILRRRKAGYTNEPIDHTDPRSNEALRALSTFGLAGQAYYSHANAGTGQAVPEVSPTIFLRESDGRTLQAINVALSDERFTKLFGGEVELFIEDGYRDPELQRKLHDEVFPTLIREQHPGISDEETAKRVKNLIAIPSTDPDGPSPHLTGAFDVSLRYKQSNKGFVPDVKVDMGHAEGETSERVFPDYFELHETLAAETARSNRRAFAAIMSGAVFGRNTEFVVNPTEWWHYSRGDQLWARVNQIQGRAVQAYRGIAKLPDDNKESAV